MSATGSTALFLLALVVLGALVVWTFVALARRLRDLQDSRTSPDAALALLQREIEAVRGETRREH